jgi:metal-sulfur cluster biosynthetic enzyme
MTSVTATERAFERTFHRVPCWNAIVWPAWFIPSRRRDGMTAAWMSTMNETDTVDQLVRAARDVVDPETGLNVIDMGLIFHLGYSAAMRRAHVVMTFTTPGCPSGGVMVDGLERRLAEVEGVDVVDVEVSFERPWTPDRITPKGRELLGWR